MPKLTKQQLERLQLNDKIEPVRCRWCNSLFHRNKKPRGRKPAGVKRYGQKTCSPDCSKARNKYIKKLRNRGIKVRINNCTKSPKYL